MPKYKITLERTHDNQIVKDWTKTMVVESHTKPKKGEGRRLLLSNPIYETITEVIEITDEEYLNFIKEHEGNSSEKSHNLN